MKIKIVPSINRAFPPTQEIGISALQSNISQKEQAAVDHNFSFAEDDADTKNAVTDSNLFELHIKGRLFHNAQTTIYFDKLYRRNRKHLFSANKEIHYEIFNNALDFYQDLKKDENVTQYQRNTFAAAVSKIIFNDKLDLLDNLNFEYNKDEFELIIFRKSEAGEYYIIIGEEEEELSYGFVGKESGNYDVLHADINVGLNQITAKFLPS